jgi:hypothetical protein
MNKEDQSALSAETQYSEIDVRRGYLSLWGATVIALSLNCPEESVINDMYDIAVNLPVAIDDEIADLGDDYLSKLSEILIVEKMLELAGQDLQKM